MKDKICLITGANSGIGFETARSLCAKGAHVLLWCRSEEKAKQALSKIKAEYPDAKADIVISDLSSQKEIRKSCAALLE
jgi:retinol dehydrogenase 12